VDQIQEERGKNAHVIGKTLMKPAHHVDRINKLGSAFHQIRNGPSTSRTKAVPEKNP
jgi:hypothetical protein